MAKILLFESLLSTEIKGARQFFNAIPGVELKINHWYSNSKDWVDVDAIVCPAHLPDYVGGRPAPYGVLIALEAKARFIPCVLDISGLTGQEEELAHDLRAINKAAEELDQHGDDSMAKSPRVHLLETPPDSQRNWDEVWQALLRLGFPYRNPTT